MSNVDFLGYTYEYGFTSKFSMLVAGDKLDDFFNQSMMHWDYRKDNIRVLLSRMGSISIPLEYRIKIVVTMDSKTRPNVPSIMETLDINATLIPPLETSTALL